MCSKHYLKLLLVGALCCFDSFFCHKEEFHESTELEFLNQKLLYTYFNFTVTTPLQQLYQNHYRIFPRPLGEILKKYRVSEVHFSLTRGIWKTNNFKRYLKSPSPTGAQLWIWFEPNTTNIDMKFRGALRSLSALFCASLEQIPVDLTVKSKLSFLPEGVEKDMTDTSLMRYAISVRDNICTENLTPWIKLLPCYSNAGVASLVDSKEFHNSHYLSLGVHAKTICLSDNCQQLGVQLRRDLTSIFDVKSDRSENFFSLKNTLDSYLKPTCPLASTSMLKLKANPILFKSPLNFHKIGSYHVCDLKTSSMKSFILRKGPEELLVDASHDDAAYTLPFVANSCFLSQEELAGRFVCSLRNSGSLEVSVSFMQIFPWFLYVKFHTLKITNNESAVIPHLVDFVPGKFRNKSSVLEMLLTLKMNSTTIISLDFNKGFLKWTEHPPDANHGFYLSPASITINSINGRPVANSDKEHMKSFSEALLINIPVPDFSMPYNVICFVCTVVAIGFGQIYQLSSRKLHYSTRAASPIVNLIQNLKNKFKRKA